MNEEGSNIEGPSYKMKDVEIYYLNLVDKIIDDSVKILKEETYAERFNDTLLLIKSLSKCYATDNG